MKKLCCRNTRMGEARLDPTLGTLNYAGLGKLWALVMMADVTVTQSRRSRIMDRITWRVRSSVVIGKYGRRVHAEKNEIKRWVRSRPMSKPTNCSLSMTFCPMDWQCNTTHIFRCSVEHLPSQCLLLMFILRAYKYRWFLLTIELATDISQLQDNCKQWQQWCPHTAFLPSALETGTPLSSEMHNKTILVMVVIVAGGRPKMFLV